jgi:hypothetical protein
MPANPLPRPGYSVRDLAARWKVCMSKIRSFIQRGELAATNLAGSLGGRPQWRVSPEAVRAFEARRAGGPPPRPTRRKKTRPGVIDFYPTEM